MHASKGTGAKTDVSIVRNPRPGIRALIEKGVNQRERGKSFDSIEIFNEAMQLSEEIPDYSLYASALGHRIVAYKHLYQKQGSKVFRNLMRIDAETGLILSIPEAEKAPFYLRMGDVYAIDKKRKLAEDCYRHAYQLVKGSSGEKEYLGHLAEAMAHNDKGGEALQIVQPNLVEAIELYGPHPNEHGLIVISGIYKRLAVIAKITDQKKLFFASVWHYLRLATTLWLLHKNPMRMMQLKNYILHGRD